MSQCCCHCSLGPTLHNQDQELNSKALAYSQAPSTWPLQPVRGQNLEPHPLGSLAAQITLGPASGSPQTASPVTQDIQENAAPYTERLPACSQTFGTFHFEGRTILHSVSMATGLSEPSAWLCSRVGHVSQTSGDPKGAWASACLLHSGPQ